MTDLDPELELELDLELEAAAETAGAEAWTTVRERWGATGLEENLEPEFLLDPETAEDTVWEMRGCTWETTAEMMSSELKDDPVLEVVAWVDCPELPALKVEDAALLTAWLLENLLAEDPDTAEETVWEMRGWTWDTTAEMMSLVLKEDPVLLWADWPEETEDPELNDDPPVEEVAPLLKLEDPEDPPLKLEDPEDPPLKLEDPEDPPLKLADPAEEDEEVCFSTIWTNPSLTSLVSEYPIGPAV